MSEARNTFGKTSITQKSKKLQPRVDLTAMVSVSFLLIVFFMLSSFLSRSNAMDFGMPDKRHIDCGTEPYCLGEDRLYTVLVGINKIVCYEGNRLDFSNETRSFKFNDNLLIKEMISKNQFLKNFYGDKKGLIVIIKPSKESNYGNLVDVLDEMAIVKVPTYAVVDITPEEEKLLADK
ncbi:biopolymer transporter ExbD [Flavobacterium sp. H122]|uniref:ExbD/TolR family protein n=1 Tax=Flavobacterium sp. H122 TaxID=2529860 RepID=UPI0010AA2C14|nr:biopolymer transporter ExbD [Flavobacterium sp. H122]